MRVIQDEIKSERKKKDEFNGYDDNEDDGNGSASNAECVWRRGSE